MARPNRLKEGQLGTLPTGTHGDGHGLAPIVHPSDSRSWIPWLAIKVAGEHVNMGLGGWPVTTLADAPTAALENRRKSRLGIDPRTLNHLGSTRWRPCRSRKGRRSRGWRGHAYESRRDQLVKSVIGARRSQPSQSPTFSRQEPGPVYSGSKKCGPRDRRSPRIRGSARLPDHAQSLYRGVLKSMETVFYDKVNVLPWLPRGGTAELTLDMRRLLLVAVIPGR